MFAPTSKAELVAIGDQVNKFVEVWILPEPSFGTCIFLPRGFAKGRAVRFTRRMFLDFLSKLRPSEPALPVLLQAGGRAVPLRVVRNLRARRYLLRLQADGSARVTIPRGGSRSEAQAFVARNHAWLEQQVAQFHARPKTPAAWQAGTEILFRGERVRLEAHAGGGYRLGTEILPVTGAQADLRPAVEWHLRWLAERELPVRVRELAAPQQLAVQRVTVRNQRRRWGSCSRRSGISLNWRLVLVPAFVRDYIILHELAHLREMNHSPRFWREVERLCPEYRAAERWLKANRELLH